MNNNYTSKEKQILLWVSLLASSQGYYGRLYEELKNNKRLLEYLVNKNFKDELEFIMFMES